MPKRELIAPLILRMQPQKTSPYQPEPPVPKKEERKEEEEANPRQQRDDSTSSQQGDKTVKAAPATYRRATYKRKESYIEPRPSSSELRRQ
jgi:hypothetical protein